MMRDTMPSFEKKIITRTSLAKVRCICATRPEPAWHQPTTTRRSAVMAYTSAPDTSRRCLEKRTIGKVRRFGNGGLLYLGYHKILRRFAVKPHDALIHPAYRRREIR